MLQLHKLSHSPDALLALSTLTAPLLLLLLLPTVLCLEDGKPKLNHLAPRRQLKQETARSSAVLTPLIVTPGVEDGAGRVQGTVKYMASLRNNGGAHICGGTLIHPRVVLTAAHCVEDSRPPRVDIGRRNRSGEDGSGYESIETDWTIIHENYSGRAGFHYDIALLVLKERTDRKPIPLSSSDFCFQTGGCEVRILGWGYTSFEGNSSTVLLEAFPRSVSTDICAEIYGDNFTPESMACAGDLEKGGIDACSGDSGGPMIYKEEQIGIISLGAECGRKGRPGVYTSIPELLPWINSQLGDIDNPPLPPSTTPSSTDPCKCTEDGVSDGVETSMIGCKAHLIDFGDNGFFCMVVGGLECLSAIASTQFLGAAWKNC